MNNVCEYNVLIALNALKLSTTEFKINMKNHTAPQYQWRTGHWLAQLVTGIIIATGVSFPLLAQTNASQQLQDDPNKAIVQAHCTSCHSAALITQNRLTRQGWLDTIRWMQDKQGLWSLGEQETAILDYLEKYYFPKTTGRRKALPNHLLPPTQ